MKERMLIKFSSTHALSTYLLISMIFLSLPVCAMTGESEIAHETVVNEPEQQIDDLTTRVRRKRKPTEPKEESVIVKGLKELIAVVSSNPSYFSERLIGQLEEVRATQVELEKTDIFGRITLVNKVNALLKPICDEFGIADEETEWLEQLKDAIKQKISGSAIINQVDNTLLKEEKIVHPAETSAPEIREPEKDKTTLNHSTSPLKWFILGGTIAALFLYTVIKVNKAVGSSD